MFDILPLLLFACLGGGFGMCIKAAEPSDSQTQAVAATPTSAVARVTTSAVAPPLRSLDETELLVLVTAALQDEYVKDKGELELRLTRPWSVRNVPDEPLTVRILDVPRNGVLSTFILRFELRTATESLGTWQLPLQARVWREIWVARTFLKRGDSLAEAEIERERRDVLALRESFAEFSAGDATLEMAEGLQAGAPLLARSVKLRPVIRRGQSADALVQDGALSVTLKVEALEDGVPGQIIRARNFQTRRDLRGKVLNEQTILVSL